MCTQAVGAIVNIMFDPIFIFGWIGFPALDVAGAAVATMLGQICSIILGIMLHHFCNKEIHVKIKGFRPGGKMIWEFIKSVYRRQLQSV